MRKEEKKHGHSSFTKNYLQIQDLDIHNKNYEFRIRVLIKLSNVEMPYIRNLGGHFFMSQNVRTFEEKDTNYRQSSI